MWVGDKRTVIDPSRSFRMTPDHPLIAGADPSHSLRMTLNISLIMTPFPQIVIQNGHKNALRKKWETGW